jgi:hypothetical protein
VKAAGDTLPPAGRGGRGWFSIVDSAKESRQHFGFFCTHDFS